jgi:glycerol-3-phosphate dehydrogenase (NAD(P)+)
MATAKAILERGEGVLIFPEGTRIRPGALGRPKRGVGRLALETGAPVVPIAVHGTEAVRNGWRIRPHKVSIRAGAPLTFPKVEAPSPSLAGAVTDRIWPCVELQWEWLGGTPSLRRAAVIGDGPPAIRIAQAMTTAGFEVEAVGEERGARRRLAHDDLVCFATPARNLPMAIERYARHIPERAGILVVADGVVPPLGTEPGAYVAERTAARAIATIDAARLQSGAALFVASTDEQFRAQLSAALAGAGLQVAEDREPEPARPWRSRAA